MSTERNKKLRVAIVGCGWVAGSQMTDGFLKLQDKFSVVVANDIQIDRAEGFARRYGISRAIDDYQAVLSDDAIDAVSICTPPSLHYQMVVDALAAGKHVICEKPFTSSLKLMDEIIAAEHHSAARVMPIFQYRFEDGFQRIQAVLRSGIAGKPYIASVETAWKRGADYYSVPWRGKFASELGGVLVTQSIHIHDLFLALFGEVASIKAFKTTRVNAIEVEDCATVCLAMQDGSLATLTATLGSQEPVTRIRLCFENMTIERQCYGSNAPKPGREPWKIVAKDQSIEDMILGLDLPSPTGLSGFASQFDAFHAALQSASEFPVTLTDSRRSLELVSAIYHAAEADVTVNLPLSPDHARYDGWISREHKAREAILAQAQS